MPELPVFRAAVVGRNVSAALWLKAACHLAPSNLAFSWHPTEDEGEGRSEPPNWLLVPDFVREELKDTVPTLAVEEMTVFLGRSRRIPVSEFLARRAPGTPGAGIHPAVRRKFLASALWSDLSPSPWRRSGPFWEPDFGWTEEVPLSFRERSKEKMWLLPRARALAVLSGYLTERGVSLGRADQLVLGVEAGSRSEPHQLVHNAPFASTPVDRVLWAASHRAIRQENARRWRRLRSPLRPYGRWMSYGKWVPSSFVAALPPVSLWIDPSAAEDFFATGLLRSRSLKRVFCIDGRSCAHAEEESWLQIDELAFTSEGQDRVPSTRQEAFLFECCPRLDGHAAPFIRAALEENAVYRDPHPIQQRLSTGIEFWSRSSLGSPAQAARDWYGRNVPKKIRKAAALGAVQG